MNSFGRKFRISIFGESHGELVGVVIDGVPAGVALDPSDLAEDLARRKSGAKGTTKRKEDDVPLIVSGLFNGHTTGAPLTIVFHNGNTLSGDYANLVRHPRPGHADMVATQKWEGFSDYRGGGHFSGRITLGLVVAGTIAKKILPKTIKIDARLTEVGGTENFAYILDQAIKEQDSVGGIIECTATGIPAGLGEPFFDSVESVISHGIFSIPGIKGIEFGAGFEAARMMGSQHNDPIIDENGTTATNNAGGINGGITSGNPLVFRVAVKPTSSISLPQETYNFETGKADELIVKGRHDACIALRVPVIVEAITAITLCDFLLLGK